ncbi:unnamed protein product, partial [marine sediment metagenome]
RDVRLPTEAEWEYACRAGTTTEYYFGDDTSQLGDYAWYSDNRGIKPGPAGQKIPNNWGLFDMHGNMKEYCSDEYQWDYYEMSPSVDPGGPTSSAMTRAIRGGSFILDANHARCAERSGARSSHGTFGFRVAVGT